MPTLHGLKGRLERLAGREGVPLGWDRVVEVAADGSERVICEVRRPGPDFTVYLPAELPLPEEDESDNGG